MGVRVLDWRLRGVFARARLPFRFGIVELRELVHAFLFATVEIDGALEVGVAAEHLAPKWFTKNPDTSYRDEAAGMIEAIEEACGVAVRCGRRESVFDLWHDVYRELVPVSPAPLLAGFGVSLVERAAIDAFCRSRRVTFAEAIRRGDLGLRLGALQPRLEGRAARELLPSRPLASLRVRHTVGLADALVGGEGPEPPDGLPATLEGCIRRYGLRRFKVKVGGDHDASLERLARVAEVLERETGGDYRVTLDGNEQLADVAALRALWDDLAGGARTYGLASRIDYVEQPLPRGSTLGEGVATALASWPGRPRVIVDEADDSLDAVARAIEAGYDGASFKSCKGVFKGISNACLLEQLGREQPGRTLVSSAEDLSTIGPVGLLADLAVIATLGLDEPERNGHHFFRVPEGLPPRVHDETVRCHGDLFGRHADGYPALRIERGAIALRSIVAAPFGVGWRCDFEDELPAAASLLGSLA